MNMMTKETECVVAPKTKRRILVVDDDRDIHKTLRTCLSRHGYQMIGAGDGRAAIEMLREKPDLVLLESDLGDMQGMELVERIRTHVETTVPIVVLTRRVDEPHKVRMLDLGADDYMTKPFGTGELLARIRVAFRHRTVPRSERRKVFICGDLCVDLDYRIVKVAENTINLSRKEYDLLHLLVQYAGKVLTHGFLIEKLWDDQVATQCLRVYVRQLRQKIEVNTAQPEYIVTEPGVGYLLRASTTPGTTT